VLTVDENDELIDNIAEPDGAYSEERDFVQMILENLKTAGVQQAHKEDKINFTSLTPWPGELICAEGRFVVDSDEWLGESKTQLATNHSPQATEMRAAIFIGPEFGTVSRPDLVAAAREAADAGFDVLIACAFNYDAHSSEFNKLGRIPVLKARMNADLHIADDLKNTGKGNLFVIFGEPDIEVASEEWLVDSRGNRVAPYDIFKLVSGVDRLAEINGLDRKDLWDYARVSNRGEIWDYIANAAGVDIHSSQYRRRTGAENNGGVSAIAWHCAGITRRTGNVSDLIRKAGVSSDPGFRALVERLRRDQQNAPRPDENAVYSPLTTIHYSQVTIHGVDVFHPNTGEVRSDGAEGIACWFIDTDYNEESFFVRHAYFLGANDPYKSLKTALRAEIDEDAWSTLYSDVSRPFPRPKTGRIAVKVINHFGDEVLKVFGV
jgi:adenine-specific DNA-methyltransferase